MPSASAELDLQPRGRRATTGVTLMAPSSRRIARSLAFARGRVHLSAAPGGRSRTILLYVSAADVPEVEYHTRSLFAAVFCADAARPQSDCQQSDDAPALNAPVARASVCTDHTPLAPHDDPPQPHPLPHTSMVTVDSAASGPDAPLPEPPGLPGGPALREGRARSSGKLAALRSMLSAPRARSARTARQSGKESAAVAVAGERARASGVEAQPRLSSRGRSFARSKRASASPQVLRSVLSIQAGEEASLAKPRQRCDSPPVASLQQDRASALPWRHLGTTEVARKLGRDVEFSSTFALTFDVDAARPVLRVVLFDAGSAPGQHRLIAFSDVSVRKVFANGGVPVASRMYLPPASLPDGGVTVEHVSALPKNRGRYNGEILVACDIVGKNVDRFRLDVECNRILRAKALTTANVKKAFYTLHGILEKGGENEFKKGTLKDHWILLYRSETCQMIHGKHHGGTCDYNHFSSARMRAGPGVIQFGERIEGKVKERSEVTKPPTSALDKLWGKLGSTPPELFFSLPGADLYLTRKNRRLKLSMFEDHGLGKGYELIAETQFTIAQLQAMEIGHSFAIKSHTNVVGRAELKFVDCDTSDPRYFCLSLVMQSM